MNKPVAAQLFVSSQCPHCAQMIKDLTDLLKQGRLARLKLVNLSVDPQAADDLGIRTVPWLQLGEFQFHGKLSLSELSNWLQQQGSPQGRAQFLASLLQQNQLSRVTDMVQQDDKWLPALVILLDTDKINYKVQLGVFAVFEELQGQPLLNRVVPELGILSQNEKANVRADAAYLLSLINCQSAREQLHVLLQDTDKEVQEIAREALEGR